MDKEQVKILQAGGFAFDAVPGLHRQPRAKYYSVDKNDGHIVEHDLPADPYSLEHYLKRGFTLSRSELKPQAVEKSQEGLSCEVCGKKFKARIGLISHSRKHKNNNL